ncbi:MAG: hypothetical protein WEB00_13965 [Dehalococcoidia bacterium]
MLIAGLIVAAVVLAAFAALAARELGWLRLDLPALVRQRRFLTILAGVLLALALTGFFILASDNDNYNEGGPTGDDDDDDVAATPTPTILPDIIEPLVELQIPSAVGLNETWRLDLAIAEMIEFEDAAFSELEVAIEELQPAAVRPRLTAVGFDVIEAEESPQSIESGAHWTWILRARPGEQGAPDVTIDLFAAGEPEVYLGRLSESIEVRLTEEPPDGSGALADETSSTTMATASKEMGAPLEDRFLQYFLAPVGSSVAGGALLLIVSHYLRPWLGRGEAGGRPTKRA